MFAVPCSGIEDEKSTVLLRQNGTVYIASRPLDKLMDKLLTANSRRQQLDAQLAQLAHILLIDREALD